MTFLEALYGSQYHEIAQRGKDGNKGRLNANLFLSAFIMICLFVLIALFMVCSSAFANQANDSIASISGNMNGKSLGKLLAIPLLGLIYFSISQTVGSKENFAVYVGRFMQYPDNEKEKATLKLLAPFLSLVVLLFVLLMFGQYIA